MSNNPVIGEPVPGQPNPELRRISGPQKIFILFIAIGFIWSGCWPTCQTATPFR
jgi:hypothetical protein